MEYKFTKDITGSNNGIVIQDYKEGQIIDEKNLCKTLLDAWKEREVIVPVAEEDNSDEKDDNLSEEELKENAKDLLKEEDVDTEKLKEIGIALKIAGMNKTTNPEKIIEKIEKYIEEHTEEDNSDEKDDNSADEEEQA